jgi:hypothetical protein
MKPPCGSHGLGQKRRRGPSSCARLDERSRSEGESPDPASAGGYPEGARGTWGFGEEKARKTDRRSQHPGDQKPEAATHPEGGGIRTDVTGDTRLGRVIKPVRGYRHCAKDDKPGPGLAQGSVGHCYRFEIASS